MYLHQSKDKCTVHSQAPATALWPHAKCITLQQTIPEMTGTFDTQALWSNHSKPLFWWHFSQTHHWMTTANTIRPQQVIDQPDQPPLAWWNYLSRKEYARWFQQINGNWVKRWAHTHTHIHTEDVCRCTHTTGRRVQMHVVMSQPYLFNSVHSRFQTSVSMPHCHEWQSLSPVAWTMTEEEEG